MPRMWTAAGRALRGGESGRQAARSLGQKKPGTRGSGAKRSYCTAGSGYETIRRKAGRDRHERGGGGRGEGRRVFSTTDLAEFDLSSF